MKHSLHSSFIPHIDSIHFDKVVTKLRKFFQNKNFIEVHTQNRLSILAACEDPFNICTFEFNNNTWPLPQTGQMWLEHELLQDNNQNGFFCLSTSYRNEKEPKEGRHNLIFPMFEFELIGGMKDLERLEIELLSYLGFKDIYFINYEDACYKYDVSIIDADIENKMALDFGNAIFLKHFPERSNPFWNMKRHKNTSNKIDVLLHGVETIGSAERSCDTEQMLHSFYTIENGAYAQKIFNLFGKERVISELDEFLKNKFIIRSGGGIGITRLIKAMQLENLL